MTTLLFYNMVKPLLSVIVPAYNEEDNVLLIEKDLLPVLDSLNSSYEVLVIDDGSSDKTFEKANSLKSDKIRLLKHKKNLGLGAAVRTGIENSKGRYVLTMDADFSFSPAQIPSLFLGIRDSGADCVIGSHFMEAGELEDVGFLRRFLSQSINKIYQIIIPTQVSAISSIFRIYDGEALKSLPLQTSGFEINVEILLHLIKRKYRILEVPARLGTRKMGKSKINFKREIKNHLKLIFKIIRWKIK